MKSFEQSDTRLLDEVRGCVGRMEVLERPTGRRSWPDEEKARIIRESLEPGARGCDVAHRNCLTPRHLSTWRSQARKGRLPIANPEEDFPAFAALEIADDAPSCVDTLIEIDADGGTIRLSGDTPAARVAEIVAALRIAR